MGRKLFMDPEADVLSGRLGDEIVQVTVVELVPYVLIDNLLHVREVENDAFRAYGTGGRDLYAPGVAVQGLAFSVVVLKKMRGIKRELFGDADVFASHNILFHSRLSKNTNLKFKVQNAKFRNQQKDDSDVKK
jgi:hypothetical protein